MTSAQPATASSASAAHSTWTSPNATMAAPHTTTATITAQACRWTRASQPVVSAPIRAPAAGAAYR